MVLLESRKMVTERNSINLRRLLIMTNSKFTAAQQERAMELLTDKGDLNIMPIEDFMTVYEPYEIAKMVKQSDLNLDCDYVRVNSYYSDTHEADDTYSLLSDDEIEEALQELQ